MQTITDLEVANYSFGWRKAVQGLPVVGTISDPTNDLFNAVRMFNIPILGATITVDPEGENPTEITQRQGHLRGITQKNRQILALGKEYAKIGITRDVVTLVACVALLALGFGLLAAGVTFGGLLVVPIAVGLCLGLFSLGTLLSNIINLSGFRETERTYAR